MIRVTIEPLTANCGNPRDFNTLGFSYDLTTGHLEIQLRDGRMCLELKGAWKVGARQTQTIAHSIAEAERIHDGSTLVLIAH